MTTILIYAGAALAEIVGCFAVWAWMRQGASVLWLAPGLGRVDKRDSQDVLNVIQAGICDGDQLGTRPDV